MRLGLGGFILIAILSLIFKTDFFSLLGGGGGGGASVSQPGVTQSRPLNDPKEQREVQFVSFVLDDTQNTWKQVLPNYGAQYRDAKLVLFRDAVNSGCGVAQSATGPFYCPADQKVYIDLGFYDELKQRFGADGDFAQAYVLAHEIGHPYRTCWASMAKCDRCSGRGPSLPISFLCGLSYKPTAWPAFGATPPNSAIFWRRAMSIRQSMRHQPSAMIACNTWRAAESIPTHLPTAAQPMA